MKTRSGEATLGIVRRLEKNNLHSHPATSKSNRIFVGNGIPSCCGAVNKRLQLLLT
jgi:hypothetical protein